MGYTHYLKFTKEFTLPQDKWVAFTDDVRKMIQLLTADGPSWKAVPLCDVVIDNESVLFNGVGDDGCETCCVYRDLTKYPKLKFCKTRGRKYDIAVTCCYLLVLRHFGYDRVTLGSDGIFATDWAAGAALYKAVTGADVTFTECDVLV